MDQFSNQFKYREPIDIFGMWLWREEKKNPSKKKLVMSGLCYNVLWLYIGQSGLTGWWDDTAARNVNVVIPDHIGRAAHSSAATRTYSRPQWPDIYNYYVDKHLGEVCYHIHLFVCFSWTAWGIKTWMVPCCHKLAVSCF